MKVSFMGFCSELPVHYYLWFVNATVIKASKKIRQNFVQWVIKVRSRSVNSPLYLALYGANAARKD
jgi:hypothetical protein